jgi:hypothetical protein
VEIKGDVFIWILFLEMEVKGCGRNKKGLGNVLCCLYPEI